jgi:UDP-N-acetylglucosamine 4,6-dehydratase/5-epimerase
MLSNKVILITGGTGSFGKAFCNQVLKKYPKVSKIIILSRDEFKQDEMKNNLPKKFLNKFRFFIGDIRDKSRLLMAFSGVDIVIHAAALKQVPAAEYNPFEFIKTNIYGAQNIIEACIYNNVKKVVALSTDKASSPINLYGATKLCSDKLFLSSNNIKGKKNITFSVVRYGNVMGSRGSVIPKLIKQKSQGFFTITDSEMTRFNLSLEQSVNLVLDAIKYSKIGGEIFVPIIPSYKILDLAKAIDNKCKIKITGIRPGEKINEELISSFESRYTLKFKNCYLVLPNLNNLNKREYIINYGKKFVPKNFNYQSDKNSKFLTILELKKLIIKNVTDF